MDCLAMVKYAHSLD
ncbi:hypothetical protein EmuJ_001105700 [Echinococcus multilocularis]|uniref:Uncharacterized protein n=1 Tax=Echinococcus multilocularis TaxID=6211 RepID=A0A068YJ44_ECHMU|nr:hypothetical protein EmuJ_001105700 [Echinococcus multilocularis]